MRTLGATVNWRAPSEQVSGRMDIGMPPIHTRSEDGSCIGTKAVYATKLVAGRQTAAITIQHPTRPRWELTRMHFEALTKPLRGPQKHGT